ncbi:MAG: hypothetical protein AABN33_09890 [Acidobacteriota bacterium]
MTQIDKNEMYKLLIAVREGGAAQRVEGFIIFNTNGPPVWSFANEVFDEAVKSGYLTSEPFTAETPDQPIDMLKLKLTEEGKRFLEA